MKYSIIFTIFCIILWSWTMPTLDASGMYVQCRTANGAIIVVKGNCPAGTTYVGPA